ncbi:MAG: PilZ domain-containing protein [Janthinobacterium lividum]
MQSSTAVRAQRVDLSFPLCFTGEDGVERKGNCLNISESGIMASFAEELDLWTTGLLHLSFALSVMVVHARVARCAERDAGLAFQFQNEGERAAMRDFVQAAAAQSTLAGGAVPF